MICRRCLSELFVIVCLFVCLIHQWLRAVILLQVDNLQQAKDFLKSLEPAMAAISLSAISEFCILLSISRTRHLNMEKLMSAPCFHGQGLQRFYTKHHKLLRQIVKGEFLAVVRRKAQQAVRTMASLCSGNTNLYQFEISGLCAHAVCTPDPRLAALSITVHPQTFIYTIQDALRTFILHFI